MISNRMRQRLLSRSPIREAFEQAEQLKRTYGADKVYDLSIGNPTAPCPPQVRQGLEESLEQASVHACGYMQSAGYPDVRQAIATATSTRFHVNLDADGIVMTSGAACGLNLLMQVTLDANDEVILFRPYYPAYHAFLETWQAKSIEVPFDEKTLLSDLAAFQSCLTKKTKMVLVNSPNNPSGLVWPEYIVKGIADILDQASQQFGHDILLVSDEPYRDLVYDDAYPLWWPRYYRNTAVVYSYSKAASIAGERIGYIALAPEFPDRTAFISALCRSLGDLGFVNAPATAQRIAKACATNQVDLAYYDRNRLALYQGLLSCGFTPLRPNGAFYLLLPAPDKNSQQLVERLAHEHIISVDGSAFGCPGYVRLSFCTPHKTIDDALPGFARVAHTYGLNQQRTK